MKVVEFNDVSMKYSDEENMVLNHVSFVINSGEYISLIGGNGSGKSTIAKLIIRLLEPTEGTIKLFETEVNSKNIGELRKNIGMIFQNPDSQFIGNTVAADVAFRLENERVPQTEMDPIIDKCLKKVGMSEFKNYEPSNLSGGQKQRIAVASNIVLPLKLLILDEATSMIDPKGEKEIMEIISSLRKENKDLTIIQITHNMNEVLSSDRAIVINEGTIKFDGNPFELFQDIELIKKSKISLPFRYDLEKSLQDEGFDISLKDSLDEVIKKLCPSK